MDRISRNTKPHSTVSEVVSYGTGDSVAIDQQGTQLFNVDPATGRPMSFMDAVIKAQGLDRDRLLRSVDEYKASFLPDDISDEDALRYAQPRLTQLPSELAEYTEQVTKARLQRAKEDQARKEEQRYKELFEERVKSLESEKKHEVEPKKD